MNELDDKPMLVALLKKDECARVLCTLNLSPDECDDIANESKNHYWGWGSSEGHIAIHQIGLEP
eukprot:15330387-Ditylum_brightwellii.AAC.1